MNIVFFIINTILIFHLKYFNKLFECNQDAANHLTYLSSKILGFGCGSGMLTMFITCIKYGSSYSTESEYLSLPDNLLRLNKIDSHPHWHSNMIIRFTVHCFCLMHDIARWLFNLFALIHEHHCIVLLDRHVSYFIVNALLLYYNTNIF